MAEGGNGDSVTLLIVNKVFMNYFIFSEAGSFIVSFYYVNLYIGKYHNIFMFNRHVSVFGRQNIINLRKTLLLQAILNCFAS